MKNNESTKRTPEELDLINNYMYEANNSICPAISILGLFIESFSFDMARPTDADLAYIKDRWGDISYLIHNQKSVACRFREIRGGYEMTYYFLCNVDTVTREKHGECEE